MRRSTAVLAGVLVAVTAPPASAELVFFKTGRSLSVKKYASTGESVTLWLRSGGELVCDRSLIDRIAPDEVPYPQPDGPGAPASPLTLLPGTPFGELIALAASRQGIDVRLLQAVIEVESNYQPAARSPKGAVGLMQLMPATVRQYSVANPFDPVANVEAGAKHLKSLLNRFELALALAAYNAGEAAVEKFRGIPPFHETREYVRRVLHLAQLER